MKKSLVTTIATILTIIALTICVAFMLSGCGGKSYPEVVTEQETAQVAQEPVSVYANGQLERINDRLVYDTDTRIVYYNYTAGGGYVGYGYMSPYCGPNGHVCRYDNGLIVEIDG